MNVHDDSTVMVTLATIRRHEMKTCKVVELHLIDPNANKERAFCGEDTSIHDRISVYGYLEDRLRGSWVGTICEQCKPLAVPFAISLSRDLEAEGRLDEAYEYRVLADTLRRETGLGLCPS